MKDSPIQHVRHITETIGERHIYINDNLQKTKNYILQNTPVDYQVELQTFNTYGIDVSNIECTLKGVIDEIIIIGTHYDSLIDTVGANDNASAVAGLIELSKIFSGDKLNKTLKFVYFVNEEPPLFMIPL